MIPYAAANDVADRWRPLTDDEINRANTLALDASYRVRRKFPSLDARIAAGEVERQEVTGVVAGMVKRAMLSPEGAVTSRAEGAGPFTEQVSYANPMGNLYFTAEDLATLSETGGLAQARSIRLTTATCD